MDVLSYFNLLFLEQLLSIGGTKKMIAVHSAKRPKGEQAETTGKAECHWSIIKVPCLGAVSRETCLNFSRKQFPLDWHLLHGKNIKFTVSPLSQAERTRTNADTSEERNCNLQPLLHFLLLDKNCTTVSQHTPNNNEGSNCSYAVLHTWASNSFSKPNLEPPG